MADLPEGYSEQAWDRFTELADDAWGLITAVPELAGEGLEAVFNVAADPATNWPVTMVGTMVAFICAFAASKPIAEGVVNVLGGGGGFIARSSQTLLALGIVGAVTIGTYAALDTLDNPDLRHETIDVIEPDAADGTGTGIITAPTPDLGLR